MLGYAFNPNISLTEPSHHLSRINQIAFWGFLEILLQYPQPYQMPVFYSQRGKICGLTRQQLFHSIAAKSG